MDTEERIIIQGDEHYCYFFQAWNCIAAPVKRNEKIIAYLDLSVIGRELLKEDKLLFEAIHNKLEKEVRNKNYPFQNKRVILSDIQEKILRLSANGYKIKEISQKIHASKASVKYHRRMICQRFQADNITHAIAKALKYRNLRINQIT